MRETWVWSLDWEDLLEKEMVTHSSILAWEIPWTGKPGVLQYLGSQRVRPDLAIKQQSTKAADNTHYCRSVSQSCLTLCDPMNCCPPGSSVHGILQARILEWVAISFSRRSSQSRDQTLVSCIAGRFFTIWATREALFSATDAFFFDISSASYGPNTGLFFFFPQYCM